MGMKSPDALLHRGWVELLNMLAMLTAMRHKAMATSVLWGTMTPASLYPVRSRTQAIGNIAKCSTEHNLLFFGETAYTTIPVNTIELMIKP